jgi:transcriptional regulator with XRE-family HTH domain
MGEHRIVTENRHFGRYLRRIREDRKLSLDAVEEMTLGYPEPVTKSHLSRIENGRAVPTFPRMFALCQVYGVPISSMAERFETDLRRGSAMSVDGMTHDEIFERLTEFRNCGRYDSALDIPTHCRVARQLPDSSWSSRDGEDSVRGSSRVVSSELGAPPQPSPVVHNM